MQIKESVVLDIYLWYRGAHSYIHIIYMSFICICVNVVYVNECVWVGTWGPEGVWVSHSIILCLASFRHSFSPTSSSHPPVSTMLALQTHTKPHAMVWLFCFLNVDASTLTYSYLLSQPWTLYIHTHILFQFKLVWTLFEVRNICLLITCYWI